jgi:hypothetical protein
VAALKNQHFVPRCLFKPFSLDRKGKAINLFNFASSRLIPNASVAGQCSGDYLYGTNLNVERSLSGIEGLFGSALSRIVAGGNDATDLVVIRFFAYLQKQRTQIAAERTRLAWMEMQDGVFGDHPQPPVPDHQELMLDALKMCMETHELIKDLKVRIVENRTNIDFVLSDDPSTLTNRYSFQKLKEYTAGLISTGTILLMPLTPSLAVLCYDQAAYNVDVTGNRVLLTKAGDVEGINEFQYLKAASNIYFSKWGDASYIHAQFDRYKDRRPPSWTEITFLVFAGTTPRGRRFVAASPEEARKHQSGMVSLSNRYPEPSRWPSVLKFRPNIKTFSNGTAIGHVRKEKWLRDRELNGPV